MLLLALLQSPVTAEALGTTLIAAAAAGTVKGLDYVFERRRERKYNDQLEAAVDSIGKKVDDAQDATDRRFDTIERQVATLSAHVIGPDGENGIRGDLREVKKRVIGLEERERDRLAAGVGLKDRRAAL